MRKWFSADHHFDHKNIIKYCNRPFATVEEMNEEIIRRHNEVVQEGDWCFFIGDVGFRKDVYHHLHKMKGEKILILGNHDHNCYQKGELHHYSDICSTKLVKVQGQKLWLSHYAHRVWPESHKGVIHLYGHSHGTLPGFGRSMDVGVDTNNFYPYSEDRILAEMKDVDFIGVDHHLQAFKECVE